MNETEISIFDVPERENTINQSQKQLEYNDLSKQSKLSKYHFDTFYEMDIYNEESSVPESNITSILCKFVIHYCTPIITKFNKFGVVLQNEHPTTVLDNDVYLSIPPNTQFEVTGLELPDVFVKFYDTRMLSSFDHVNNRDLVYSGEYGLFDAQTKKFTQQREGFTHPGHLRQFKKYIYFENHVDTESQLNALIKYIKYITNYYNVNYLTLFNDLKIKPYTVDFLNDGCAKWLIKRDQNKPLEKKFNAIIETFGKSFVIDFLLTLQQNNLLYVYNVGNILGINNDIFKRTINTIEDQLEYKVFLNTQKKYILNNQLLTAKKRLIAYEKYKERDLHKLDKKQLKVLHLELNKLNKRLKTFDSITGKQNRKLWLRLRRSFDLLDKKPLKEAIKDIKKNVSHELLDGNELIEGGVCPHIYNKALVTLKYFNDQELF